MEQNAREIYAAEIAKAVTSAKMDSKAEGGNTRKTSIHEEVDAATKLGGGRG